MERGDSLGQELNDKYLDWVWSVWGAVEVKVGCWVAARLWTTSSVKLRSFDFIQQVVERL